MSSSRARSAPTPSARVARRREAARLRIVEVAARRFASAGVNGVRLEEIAEEADVARGTLYSHFPSKEELLVAVLMPLLEEGVEALRAIEAPAPRQGVEALLRVYLGLFARYPDALRIAYQLQSAPLGGLAASHGAFLREVLRLLLPAEQAGLLRAREAVLAARVLSKVAVPLLELYASRPDAEELFLQSLLGLLLS